MLALSDTKIHLKASKIVSSNYHTIAVILHASKVILKFLQAKFQQNMNFQMFKLDLEKAEEPESNSYISWIKEKQESSRKTSTSALLIMPTPLCGSQQTVENSSRDGNTRPPHLPS